MHRASLTLIALLFALGLVRNASPANRPTHTAADEVHTFSLIAYDPDKQEWGIAVASKYLAVGAVVPWARAGVGAVATQSAVNITYGSKGLELLAQGKNAAEVVKALTDADPGKEARQLGVVDARGNVANFSGKNWPGKEALLPAPPPLGTEASAPDHLPFGPSLSAALARRTSRPFRSTSVGFHLIPCVSSPRPPCAAGSRRLGSRSDDRPLREEVTLSHGLQTPLPAAVENP